MDNFSYENALSKCKTLEDITGKNGLVQMIVKDAIEKVLQREFNEYIEKSQTYRNGYSKKKVKTEYGEVDVNVPRDRDSNFKPEIIAKRETTSSGIKDRITSMYAKECQQEI